jgi:two-component system sensor histidine kinase/response regulator
LGLNDQVLGVSIDISEQRRAEIALAEALGAAEESNKAKSEFLANMSHEIRTPMNCVIGLADLLKDMDPNPRQQQYLDMIRMSGATLLTLINDILDISKIEAGQLELDVVDTDVHALIEETVTQIAFTAQTKGLDMVCRLAPGVPSQLMLDPGRLRQVLTNLLNNAAKFTQQGHIYLNIEPVGEHDGQLDLCFRVTDTGIGVEQANLDRIFEKFTQAEAGTTRRFGGTGLGLSISQHLVNLMQGEITATSEVGLGTTFSFTVPLRPSVSDLQPAAVIVESDQRVLVVTDHELSGEVLAEQVRTLGHGCQVAIGCEAATAAIDDTGTQAPWTLILVDQSFVERDLPQLKARLDAAAAHQRPQVVMLANISSLHKAEQLTQLGLDGALNKPVRLSQLDDIINGCTDTRAAARSANPAPEAAAESINLETNPDQGPRILLAEDNPFNQKVAVAMLRMLGCRVDVAATGVEAVDMARHHEHDLVLMDCQMPVMDGYEATRRIRQLPGSAGEINIVAMTANALSGDRKACFAAGMNDFLSKPITRDMLHDMLEKWDVFAGEPESVSVD